MRDYRKHRKNKEWADMDDMAMYCRFARLMKRDAESLRATCVEFEELKISQDKLSSVSKHLNDCEDVSNTPVAADLERGRYCECLMSKTQTADLRDHCEWLDSWNSPMNRATVESAICAYRLVNSGLPADKASDFRTVPCYRELMIRRSSCKHWQTSTNKSTLCSRGDAKK